MTLLKGTKKSHVVADPATMVHKEDDVPPPEVAEREAGPLVGGVAVSSDVLITFLPITVVVFLCFLGIGAAVAVIPSYLKLQLGFSSFTVGLVIASQYLTMFVARLPAGTVADTRGPKTAVMRGGIFFLLCGMGYIGSAIMEYSMAKVTFLILGRAMLGIAESFIVTGALAWAIGRVGTEHASKVMAWNGNAMYGGVAVGAPLGVWVSTNAGFGGVAFSCIVLALASLGIAALLEAYQPVSGRRLPFYKMLGLVYLPGVGLLLATVGYGVIVGFSGLLFQEQKWGSGSSAIFSFGFAYVVTRLFGAGLPDRFGGLVVALYSLCAESLGQGLLYCQPSETWSLLGAVLSGAGFSLLVPALGVEVVRRTPQSSRGTAMGGYLAFFDLSFGLMIPLCGLLADLYTTRVVFLVGLLSSVFALSLTLKMMFWWDKANHCAVNLIEKA